MGIIRTYHDRENPYVQINSGSIRDTNLDLAATGLFAYMFSFRDDWLFNIPDLCHRKKIGKRVVYGALNDLIQHGYAIRYQDSKMTIIDGKTKRHLGRMEYLMFETPLSYAKRKSVVLKSANAPYFPDDAKFKEANPEIQKNEAYEPYGELSRFEHAQPEHSQAERTQDVPLSINEKSSNNENRSIIKGKEINEESLPFSTKSEEKMKSASTQLKPSKDTSAAGSAGKKTFKLTEAQAEIYSWLKDQGLNTDDDTLNYWARKYSPHRLKEVINFGHARRAAGQNIPNLGGWVHKLLMNGLAVVNDECKNNREFAEEFARAHKWGDLKIYEKYVKDEVTGDDLPLTMTSEAFIRALESLYRKSQLYKNM
jgi:hypothetical protein